MLTGVDRPIQIACVAPFSGGPHPDPEVFVQPRSPAPPVGPSDAESGSQRTRSPGRPIIAVVLVALAVRLFALASFPDVQADEGLWTNSTKNFVLFGDWFMDGRNHLFLSPVYHFLSVLSFRLLGASVEAARLVSALAGVGVVGLTYALGVRLTGDRTLAVVAAALLAVDPWAVIHSRQALTESVLLFFIVASGVLILGRTPQVALGGLVFGFGILTKLNVAAMGLAFGGYLLLRTPDGQDHARWRRRMTDGAVFGATALGLAALGYWAVSFIDPDRFVAAFRRELGGQHVVLEGAAPPPSGRWGLDPIVAGRSLLEVIRLNPFLFCLGSVGGVLIAFSRSPGRLFLLLWAGVAVGFPLTQIYQPFRYFFPMVPAFAVLGAMTLTAVASGFATRDRRRILIGGVALVLSFNLAYLATSYAASPGNRAQMVEQWVRENTDPSERLLVAQHFATNPPNPAYTWDLVAEDEASLLQALEDLEIRYVIWDNQEWPAEYRALLSRTFPEIHRWWFGSVFHITQEAEPSGVEPPGPQ